MNKLLKIMFCLTVYTCLVLPFGSATPVADSSWYEIDFHMLPASGESLHDNSIQVWHYAPTNLHFAQIVTTLKPGSPSGSENLRLRFTTPGGIFRFTKITNPTKWMDAAVRFHHEPLQDLTVVSMEAYPIVIGEEGSQFTTINLYVDITSLPHDSGRDERGNYYFPLQVQIIDMDGNVIAEQTFQLMVYFISKDTAIDPITLVTIDQYAAAQEIPFVYPFQSGLPAIKVGGVNFQSNEEYDKCRLRISPVGQTLFQFNHANLNLGGAIMYRVTIPGRTVLAYDQAFECDFEYKGTVGDWYDFLEIAVRDVNYNNYQGIAGGYASTIRIDLVSF